MTKFPVDAPKKQVIKTLESLGFLIVFVNANISPRTYRNDSGKCGRNKNAFDNAESFASQRFDIANNLHSSRDFAGRLFESV